MPLAKTYFDTKYLEPYDRANIYQVREIKLLSSNNKIYDEIYENEIDNIDLTNFNDYKLIFDKKYSLYANYFRVTKCDIFSKESYIFLGCSYVYGIGVNDNETLTYYFSEEFNFTKNIINCGVSGKATNMSLNILNNDVFENLMSKEIKIKHCFYFLIEDHIYRNFRYESGSMDGALYKNNKFYIPTVIGKIKYILARSYIFRKVFVSIIDEQFKQYYENYIVESLKEINKIVEEKYKSKLTIIVWPEFDDKSFVNKLKETRLDLIFLPKYFNSERNGYKIKNDGHPTAKANQEIAKILCNHINEIN